MDAAESDRRQAELSGKKLAVNDDGTNGDSEREQERFNLCEHTSELSVCRQLLVAPEHPCPALATCRLRRGDKITREVCPERGQTTTHSDTLLR